MTDATRELAPIRAELARVRCERRRVEAALPEGSFLADELDPKQRQGFDKLGPLFRRERELLGSEWMARGGGLLTARRGRLTLCGGEEVLAPLEARRGVAQAWARILRRRHPGTSWEVEVQGREEP